MPYRPKRICNRCGKAVSGRCDCKGARRIEHRPDATKRGYDRNWRKARAQWLHKNPLCVDCSKAGRTTEAKVVDHIVPHRGNKEVFWDNENWQSLCEACHNKKTRSGL